MVHPSAPELTPAVRGSAGAGIGPILAVIGTRPEAIKMARVVAEGKTRGGRPWLVLMTGQHGDLLDPLLVQLELEVSIRLEGVMEAGISLAELTARLLRKIDGVLAIHQPSCVVVQGDTTSAWVAALAAFYRGIPVAHVEAGLRTWHMGAPFPEEWNRQGIDRLSSLHFAPTEWAGENLRREGVHHFKVTGNPGIDTLHWKIRQPVDVQFPQYHEDGMVLITAHRRENQGLPLIGICEAVRLLARSYPGLRWVFPVHPNPVVVETVHKALHGLNNVDLLAPVGYTELIGLLRKCKFVMTDSGGIQEEAPSLGKPVLILRDTTERPEGVEVGVARLVGTDPNAIMAAARLLLDFPQEYEAMARRASPYGDGHSAERIVDEIIRFLQGGNEWRRGRFPAGAN
ncbi:MAG: UDP-N-acetylglucosamine 2-epimerase (non-hydrolyzing) [Verrucomicrobiota bacterium]|nr:UDP-N-acetylglucosamine 2-epimerase (non-hydrolyzing) [Verrucomicrobiota bacterium]